MKLVSLMYSSLFVGRDWEGLSPSGLRACGPCLVKMVWHGSCIVLAVLVFVFIKNGLLVLTLRTLCFTCLSLNYLTS